jgi:hypothetical protein
MLCISFINKRIFWNYKYLRVPYLFIIQILPWIGVFSITLVEIE